MRSPLAKYAVKYSKGKIQEKKYAPPLSLKYITKPDKLDTVKLSILTLQHSQQHAAMDNTSKTESTNSMVKHYANP